MNKYIIIVCVILLLLNMSMYSQKVTKVGTTAAPFLNIDVGARAAAMGGAFVAVTNDATAMYWNPSGIARIPTFEAVFNNARWIADVSFNYAALVMPLGNIGTFGANATFLTMDDMERTTINQPDGTGELFDAGSYAFGLSYARNITDRFAIGFNFKYINEKIYNSSAIGMAFDVGTIFDTPLYGLKLGMSITNYGTKMQMEGRDMQTQKDVDTQVSGNNPTINASLQTEKYDLPLMFRVGLSVDLLKGRSNSNLILSVDANHPNDDVESVNIGGEYIFNQMFSVRGGYKSLFTDDSEQGLSLGAGIKYQQSGSLMIYIDYAFLDFGLLNEIHMFSFGLGI